MGVLGWRTEDSWGRAEKKAFSEGLPWKGIGASGVRVSAVMVTGRQNVEESELKRANASCSSGETGWFVSVEFNGVLFRAQDPLYSSVLPVIPDCMMLHFRMQLGGLVVVYEGRGGAVNEGPACQPSGLALF